MFKNLVKWSSQYEHLPWRKERNLYTTLVSEIMLQQTTVGTVLNHFERFLEEYPTIFDLASASENDLTISWKGLGYYRRARNLKKACEFIVNEYDGKIPLDYHKLITIPGIGDYTASALLSIGADKPVFAIDANIERVLARVFKLALPKGKKLNIAIKEIEQKQSTQKDLLKFGPRQVNEALMDLGRNYCKANAVFCELCPLSTTCLAVQTKKPLAYPIKEDQAKTKFYDLHLLRIIVQKKEKVLSYKKEKGEWLEGQFELPTFILESEDEKLKQYSRVIWDYKDLPNYKTSITKYKITNYILNISEAKFKKDFDFGNLIWCDPNEKSSNLSTASSKALIKNREKR